MSLPHGSQLPQVFEGAPFHSDSFMVSFNIEAVGGVFPYAGAVVTLATDADETCKLGTSGAFVLGVCEESGILQGQINVIIRGVVTVTATGDVTQGDILDFNSSADGTVIEATGVPADGVRMVALTSVGDSGGSVLALLL